MGTSPKRKGVNTMDDIMNKSQETAPESKNEQVKEGRFDWIGNGFAELQEEGIEVVLKPTVKISQDRYDELLHKEETLNILCRVLVAKEPYDMSMYRAIAGENMTPEKAGEDE